MTVYYGAEGGDKTARESKQGRLTRLKGQLARVEAQIRREQALENKTERKKDTRRKILLGAIVLKEVEKPDYPDGWLQEFVDPHLIRDDDRALFGLAPLEDKPNY